MRTHQFETTSLKTPVKMEDSTLNVLPIEILESIIGRLPVASLITLSSVCKELNSICKNIYGYVETYQKGIQNGFECKCGMGQNALTLMTNPFNLLYIEDKIKLYNNDWFKIPKMLILDNNYARELTYSNKAIVNLITTINNLYYIYIQEFMNEYFSNLLSVHLPKTVSLLIFNNQTLNQDKISIDSNDFRNVKQMTFINYSFDEHRLNFATLSFLCLSNCFFTLTDTLKEQFSNIETLELLYCYELYSQTSNMNYLKNNKHLIISSCKTSSIDFKHFSTCEKLESLKIDFENNEGVSTPYENISELGKGKLQCLKISENTNQNRIFENLNGLENIPYLHLNNFYIRSINNKMNNHTLCLSNSNITNSKLRQLIGVKRLCITHNKYMNDITALGSEESKLEILDLSYNPNIKYIDSLTTLRLKALNVVGCDIMIHMLNPMHEFNTTRVFIENCYCETCRWSYKYTDLQHYALIQPITVKCLYHDKYNYFHF